MAEAVSDDAETCAAPTELGVSIDQTAAVTAWALDDGEEWEPARRLTPGRITAAAVVASVAAASVVGVLAYRQFRLEKAPASAGDTSMVPAAVAPVTTTASPIAAPPSPPELKGVDGEFIAEMRGYGVPVSDEDPGWTIDMAHAVCATAHDGGPKAYPPGTHTVMMLTEGMMEYSPDWTRQQASRFINGAVDQYCPDVRGPSQREIAVMPPDDRYLAMLQDRLGITPVDDSIVRVGRQVCNWKAQNWGSDKIIDAINSPNPREDEQLIVEIAIAVYCPQYADR